MDKPIFIAFFYQYVKIDQNTKGYHLDMTIAVDWGVKQQIKQN